MKKNNNQKLDDFENYLLQLVKERPKTPFSTKEVLQILQSYNPPDDLEGLRDERIIQLMKNEYEKRAQQEIKLKNFSLIHSLGELIRTYCDFQNISPLKLSQLIGISKEEFEKCEKDKVSPAALKKGVLSNVMLLIGVPINDMIQILRKSINLFQIKQNTNISLSYARMKKDIDESQKMQVRNGAMTELLLTLKDEEEAESDEFENLKNELVEEYEKIQTEYDIIRQCYTIKTKPRSDKINNILQQL